MVVLFSLILFLFVFFVFFVTVLAPGMMRKSFNAGRYDEAYYWSLFLTDPSWQREIEEEIKRDYEAIKDRSLSEKSVKELKTEIRYMGILEKRSIYFLPIISESRRRKNEELLKTIHQNISSESWRKVLREDLDKLQGNAG